MTIWLRCPKRKNHAKVSYETCLFNCASQSAYKRCQVRRNFEKTIEAYSKISKKVKVYFEE